MKIKLYPPQKKKIKSNGFLFRVSIVSYFLFFTVLDAFAATSFISTNATICKNSNVTFSVNRLALSSNTNLPAPFEAIRMYLHNGTSFVLIPANDPIFTLLTDNNGNTFKEEFRVNMTNDPTFIGIKIIRIECVDNAGNVAVMDITLTVGDCQTYTMDYGDAPDASVGTGVGNYNTTAADNGAGHIISPLLFIGNVAPDSDPGNLQKAGAMIDDISNTGAIDDEEGVTIFPGLYTLATSYSLTVTVTNNTNTDATLSGWIDFNKNGVFELNERVQAVIAPGATSATLTWTGIAGLTSGDTYARFRIATDLLQVEDATGIAGSGEVEDYKVIIKPSYTVCGNVFLDLNGLIDNLVSGEGTNGDDRIYAILVNSSGNVVADTLVATNGTYCFTNVIPQTYSVILSTTPGTINSPAPSPSLPPIWRFSGENIGATPGNDGQTDGILHFTVSNSNINEVNFGVQSPAIIGLPLKLSHFSATQQNCTAYLKWETVQEINSARFDVELSTDGGRSFTIITNIAAAGNSDNLRRYEYSHPLMPGLNIFRLSMVDIDGTSKYSSVVFLKCGTETRISVFPNPATTNINVVGMSTGKKEVSIASINGSILGVYETTTSYISINTANLPAGIYILKIKDPMNVVTNYKFIKQ